MKIRSLIFSLTLLSLFNTAIAADEPIQTGDIITQSTELVFRQRSQLKIQLIPEKDLLAGLNNHGKQVAIFNVTSTLPVRLGIRWTPDTGDITQFKIKVHGKNNLNNLLQISIAWWGHDYVFDDGWYITRDPEQRFNGSIKIYEDQKIAADTYTISMDASAFIS